MVRESLDPVAKAWKLDQPVLITPFEQFLEKFSQKTPSVRTRRDFSDWLQINSRVSIERLAKGEKTGGWTTPLKILMNFAPRPDDNRDKFLPYDPWEQFWFGSGVASASQAFRHMEKPSFQILHPLNTFGFPLGKMGQATRRAQIYFDLAVMAYHLGEPYWAWNFLGCGMHYIQDLQNPYHTVQLLIPVLMNTPKAYWNWGHKKGLIPAITHLTSNVHHYFEGYVEWVLKPQTPLDPIMDDKETWIEALKHPGPETEANFKPGGAIQQLAKNIRDFSNRRAYETVRATLQLSGENLLGAKDYAIGTNSQPFPEDPTPFFNSNEEERKAAAAIIGQIVKNNFEYQGMALRTVVQAFLSQI